MEQGEEGTAINAAEFAWSVRGGAPACAERLVAVGTFLFPSVLRGPALANGGSLDRSVAGSFGYRLEFLADHPGSQDE